MSPASREEWINSSQHTTLQQETIVHIISILNITRYAAQVNRQHINIVMDTVNKMVHDVNNLYNITTSLYTSLSYHQLVLHIRSVIGNLWDLLSYIRTVSMHTYGLCQYSHYWNTFTPHVLPIADLKTDIITHWGNTTSYHAFTCVIWGYPTLL